MDAFLVERTSDHILECLAGFGAQWGKFSDAVDLLGRRFESTQKAYDDLAGVRRRQLQKHLDRVDSLREERGLEPLLDDGRRARCRSARHRWTSDLDDEGRPALRAVSDR